MIYAAFTISYLHSKKAIFFFFILNAVVSCLANVYSDEVSLISDSSAPNFIPSDQEIMFITIGKGGTHLLQKTLEIITGQKSILLTFDRYEELANGPELYFQNSSTKIIGMHFLSALNVLKNNIPNTIIKVALIRDPRDIVISTMCWMQWIIDNVNDYPSELDNYIKLSIEDQILTSIQESQDLSVQNMVKNALLWIKDPSVFYMRFEDLVGPEGGGSLEKQKAAIQALALHLGCCLSDDCIGHIAGSLFGNTRTFRKGQINTWKEYFTPYHKKIFKEIMGNELIQMGYEKDDNW